MVQTTIVSVVSVQHLAENILRIEIDRPVGFNFKPGQFARVGINQIMMVPIRFGEPKQSYQEPENLRVWRFISFILKETLSATH